MAPQNEPPKARLHNLLRSRGIPVPEYVHATTGQGEQTRHTARISIVIGKQTHAADGGPASKMAVADAEAAEAMLKLVEGKLRSIPVNEKVVIVRKVKGSHEELYRKGEYADALKKLCQAKQLPPPKITHTTNKVGLFAGGRTSRQTSVQKQQHNYEITVGDVTRTGKNYKDRAALLQASLSVYNELQRIASLDAKQANCG